MGSLVIKFSRKHPLPEAATSIRIPCFGSFSLTFWNQSNTCIKTGLRSVDWSAKQTPGGMVIPWNPSGTDSCHRPISPTFQTHSHAANWDSKKLHICPKHTGTTRNVLELVLGMVATNLSLRPVGGNSTAETFSGSIDTVIIDNFWMILYIPRDPIQFQYDLGFQSRSKSMVLGLTYLPSGRVKKTLVGCWL